MKLYTEEQVRFIATRFKHKCLLKGIVTNNDTVDYFNELHQNNYFGITPIELPSDEDIEFQADELPHISERVCFEKGAKWVKNFILNQTNQ